MNSEAIQPVWFDVQLALAVHDRQLAEHGGGMGIRHLGALESALMRPVDRWTCGETDLRALSAAYAFGIARNDPFVDGNKRTAWIAARSFLILNGLGISYGREDAITLVFALAAGELPEDELAHWLRDHLASS